MFLFLAHFSDFWDIIKKKTLALSHTTTHGPITPYWVSQKSNEPIPRKLLD